MSYIYEDDKLGITRLELGPYGTNAYIAVCKSTGESLVVDAPGEPHEIAARLAGTSPRYIVITHNHVDHIGALEELREQLKVPVAIHALDARGLGNAPDMELEGGQILEVGALKVKVLHTPGHTPGSICLHIGGCLLAGDTIFPGGPGHTVSPESFKAIVESVRDRILVLPPETVLFPGHGQSTTVGSAREEFAVFSSKRHEAGLCGDVLWLET
jgi:glyoxylase-like metal-dependent hydrolase (beta-lactamase superfamily II)